MSVWLSLPIGFVLLMLQGWPGADQADRFPAAKGPTPWGG